MYLVVRCFDTCQRQLLADVGRESRNAKLSSLLHVHSCTLVLVREHDVRSDEVDVEGDVRLEEMRELLPDMRW